MPPRTAWGWNPQLRLLPETFECAFGGLIEGHVGDGGAAAVFIGGNLHFTERPDFIRDFHHIFDLEFLEELSAFGVAVDFHECTKFGVNPDINCEVISGGSGGLVETELVGLLGADVLGFLQFRVWPVKKAEGEVFVGEVGSGNGFREFVAGEVDSFSVYDFKKVVFVVVEPQVKDTPFLVFKELELDVLSFEENSDRCFPAIVGQVSLEAFVELGQGSRKSCAFEDTVSIGCLCVRQWGNGQWGNEKGCDEKSLE